MHLSTPLPRAAQVAWLAASSAPERESGRQSSDRTTASDSEEDEEEGVSCADMHIPKLLSCLDATLKGWAGWINAPRLALWTEEWMQRGCC